MVTFKSEKIKMQSAFIMILVFAAAVFPGCINKPAVWGNPGDAKKEFLGKDYDKIVIELDYESNTDPDSDALALLCQRLKDVCQKEVKIVISNKIIDSKTSYSYNEICTIESEYRDYHNQYIDFEKSVFYAYVLYLNGTYSESDRVIGLAYSADSFCIFQENIKNNVNQAGLRPTASDVEKSVVVHEFGHLLNLVSRGQDPAYKYKEDSEHPHHSENKNSVMYWAVDTTDVIGAFLNGGTPNNFDESDRQEMDTYR